MRLYKQEPIQSRLGADAVHVFMRKNSARRTSLAANYDPAQAGNAFLRLSGASRRRRLSVLQLHGVCEFGQGKGFTVDRYAYEVAWALIEVLLRGLLLGAGCSRWREIHEKLRELS
jgi:hypothetical protein